MKIGLVGRFGDSPRRDAGYVRSLAQACEGAGFASLWAPEHVVFFGSYRSRYPYSPDGQPPWTGDTGIFDPLFVCALAAAVTTTLQVGTAVLILPQRPALLTAKEALTLDHLSNGRFRLGAGAGWSAEEYAALGVPFANRGRRFDEYLQAMRAAWTQDRASFHGEFVSFDDVVLLPKPVTPGGPPILIGGESPAAMRRAARLGDGWYGWWAAGELAPHLANLRRELELAGRQEGDDFHLQLGIPYTAADSTESILAKVAEAERCGVAELVLGVPIGAAHLDRDIARWAEALGL
ncbi:MAG: LLM class F420-dependent oxidoreductase [Pseudomonadales bacterium]